MGNVLSLIIVFNLGLALHLRAIEKGARGTADSSTERRDFLEKSLRLYEIAHKFLKRHYSIGESIGDNNGKRGAMQNKSGIQFRIILCNNIYHAQRHLNSINSNNKNNGISSAIETIRDGTTNTQYNKYLEELLSTLMCISEREVYRISSEDNSNSNHFIEDCPERRLINLEGFWKTVDHLVLKSKCADAA